jgi:hypothetical protein
LGGGYGIGFPKYGMGLTLVKGIEVVLASAADVCHIEDTDTDPAGSKGSHAPGSRLMPSLPRSYHKIQAEVMQGTTMCTLLLSNSSLT